MVVSAALVFCNKKNVYINLHMHQKKLPQYSLCYSGNNFFTEWLDGSILFPHIFKSCYHGNAQNVESIFCGVNDSPLSTCSYCSALTFWLHDWTDPSFCSVIFLNVVTMAMHRMLSQFLWCEWQSFIHLFLLQYTSAVGTTIRMLLLKESLIFHPVTKNGFWIWPPVCKFDDVKTKPHFGIQVVSEKIIQFSFFYCRKS